MHHQCYISKWMKMADMFIHAKKKLIFLKQKSQKLYAKMHLNKRINLLR